MTAIALSVILFAASLVVLGAVVASGLGPLRSLRKATERMREVREEADRLRRTVEVLEQRRRRLGDDAP